MRLICACLAVLSENETKGSSKKYTNNSVLSFLISSKKLEIHVAKGC